MKINRFYLFDVGRVSRAQTLYKHKTHFNWKPVTHCACTIASRVFQHYNNQLTPRPFFPGFTERTYFFPRPIFISNVCFVWIARRVINALLKIILVFDTLTAWKSYSKNNKKKRYFELFKTHAVWLSVYRCRTSGVPIFFSGFPFLAPTFLIFHRSLGVNAIIKIAHRYAPTKIEPTKSGWVTRSAIHEFRSYFT